MVAIRSRLYRAVEDYMAANPYTGRTARASDAHEAAIRREIERLVKETMPSQLLDDAADLIERSPRLIVAVSDEDEDGQDGSHSPLSAFGRSYGIGLPRAAGNRAYAHMPKVYQPAYRALEREAKSRYGLREYLDVQRSGRELDVTGWMEGMARLDRKDEVVEVLRAAAESERAKAARRAERQAAMAGQARNG